MKKRILSMGTIVSVPSRTGTGTGRRALLSSHILSPKPQHRRCTIITGPGQTSQPVSLLTATLLSVAAAAWEKHAC
jgi:hypothetical protein